MSWFSLSLFAVFSISVFVVYGRSIPQRTVSYEGEVLVRCSIRLLNIKSFLSNDDVDVWSISPDGEADLRVSEHLLKTSGLDKECTKISDIESLIQKSENYTVAENADWFEAYHPYEEIVEWYKGLTNHNTLQVSFTGSIGQSIEGRAQPALRISANNNPRGTIYSQCLIHAREWISGATCMYIVNYLLENYDSNEQVNALIKEADFVFVPFVNPDGYEYTWGGDRLWRKNRRVNSGSSCMGVDLNRNYNEHWSEGGSSSNPCSETYHGTGPESEPETQNTANYFRNLEGPPIVGAIDWHSYSQLILRPYGWTNEDSPDEVRLRDLGIDMSQIIQSVHGKIYTPQKGIGLYPTSGTARDWFYSDNANANNGGYRAAGHTIELRDTGTYGFLLPPDQIKPQGEEMVPGFLMFAESLIADPLRI